MQAQTNTNEIHVQLHMRQLLLEMANKEQTLGFVMKGKLRKLIFTDKKIERRKSKIKEINIKKN